MSFVKYLLSNTEELGMMTEKIICDLIGLQFKSKRNYEVIPKVKETIESSIGGYLRSLDIHSHTGNVNKSDDFITCLGHTISIKTNMNKSFKVCPQNIGQVSLKSFNIKTNLDLKNTTDFKTRVLGNTKETVSMYLENLFTCKYMIYFKYLEGKVLVFEKTGEIVINSIDYTTSKTIDSWNESMTLYADKKALCEFQVHSNRDSLKCRFNMDRVVDLVKSKSISGVSVSEIVMDTRYEFKIGKVLKEPTTSLKMPRSFSYIGSKLKLLDFIKEGIEGYIEKPLSEIQSFGDLMSGTGVVSFFLIQHGCKKIVTNDIQNYASVLSSVWTTDGIDTVKIRGIIKDINEELESITQENIISSEADFIYNNYSPIGDRMYFTEINAFKIDKVRQKIKSLQGEITLQEHNLLLKTLLYSSVSVGNISSTWGAYLKKFKATASRPFVLDYSTLDLLVESQVEHLSFNKDICELDLDFELEVCYIDSPYNNRVYSKNFFIPEIISIYDSPEIKGKTGLPVIDIEASKLFCSKKTAKDSFEKILKNIKSRFIFTSYSSDSILSKKEMTIILEKNWENIRCIEKDYKRFKSNKNGKQQKTVVEYLFCASKKKN